MCYKNGTMKEVNRETDSSSVHSERDLCAAIISQAVEDVTVKWPVGKYNYDLRPPDDEIKKALLFLTATSGQWKESRVIICDAVGLDPDYVRTRVLQAIERGEEYRRSDYSSDYEIDDEAENDIPDESW